MMSLLDGSGMTGDIWSTGAFSHDSPLKDLMDSDDFTLEQLLAEDELLQELRGLHPQLLDYFSTEAAVTKLVEYLILDPNSTTTTGNSSSNQEEGTGDGAAEAETPSDSDPNNRSNSPTPAVTEAPSDEEKGEEKEADKAVEEKENEGAAGQEEQKEEQQQQDGPAEPGKWMFQHLEESRSGDDDNNNTEKDKHPERIPDNRFIRFPYMACEIICCEMQGVINVLVDGFVPLPEVQKHHHHKKSADSPTTTDTTTNSSNDDNNTNNNPATSTSDSPGEGIEESKDNDDDDDLSEQSQIQSSSCSSSSSEEPEGGDNNRQRILDLLFSVLYNTEAGQLDDFRAGYLEKILSVLFRVRPEAMSEYINTGGGRGNVSLMKAMFRHLYSHSMMQLVQRLLLPTPQHLQQQNDDNSDNEDDDNSDDEDDEDNLILGAQMGGMLGDDQDDESKTLRCNWSDSGEALDLLLQPLIYPNASPSAPTTEVDSDEKEAELSDEERDLKLNLSQNSSEVLITIIQNSPLNSETMLRLTVDPVMERLVERASCWKDGEEFSHHESNLTATMNVLESLILQLGGYGSVGTISLMPDEKSEGEDGQSTGEQPPPPQFADLKSLLFHIPRLLESLSILLRHPSCEKWRSPMQFSEPTDPQLLLGMSRLRIVRLLESLVLLGESNVDSLLCQSDCLEICLDLFWKFQWCSMLHQSVANLLVHVFEGANARSEMQEYFLVKCNLLGRLMSSFVEVAHPGEPSFGPHDHAIADFSAQEVVFGMKNLKMENENAPVNAPQPNDLGGRTDDEVGRVPTDDIIPVSDDDVDAVLEQQEADGAGALADLTPGEPAKELNAQEESVLSVGQISTEAVRFESRDASVVSATLDAPAQSFRLGYMGHVIIICQALVHACSTENEEPENTAPDSTMEEEDDPQMSLLAESQQEQADLNGERSSSSDSSSSSSDSPPPPPSDGESPADEVPMGRDDGESARAGDSDAEGIPPPSVLMLSKLIDSHPLQTRWHEFVRTTLATETTIQSTPLGGYNNNPLPGGDPLHAHRPLGDDDDFDDGSGQPNMPPRGMLGGGDVLDLDDNDLDIAASMMAGLHMGRGGNGGDDDDDDEDDSDEDGDDVGSSGSGNTYDENAAKGGYFFDDPLGNKRESGLGLALGNLKTYHAGSSDEEEGDDDDDDSDKASSSDQSSEEEADRGNSLLRRTGSDGDDVPVMNLFAGNLPGAAGEPTATFDDNTWSNFANFDDAFAAASASPADAGAGFVADFEHADMGSEDKEKPDMDAAFADNFADNFEAPKTADNENAHRLDDIFGKPTSHPILLEDDDDTPKDTKASPDAFAMSDSGDNNGPEASSETPEATEEEESPEVTDS